jgi:phage minor structural protein
MQIAKYIEIKVADKAVAFLSPEADGMKDAYVDIRLNGESTLEFSLPSNSDKASEITAECEIYANNRVYNLLKDEAIDEVMDESGKMWTKFMAVERWNELNDEYVEPYVSNDPSIPVPADLAVIIVGAGNNLSDNIYPTGTASHALYAILNGSEWSLGICDVTGIHDLEMEKASRLTIIKQVQGLWGGYLVWDSVNKVVHLRSSSLWQNYTGFQVRYAKNMKHITRTQSNKLVTKLYCFGADDLDIASVNGGLKYITDFSYTTKVHTNIYSNPDVYDATELMELGYAELAVNCKPRYNYKAKIVDLRTLPEYSHEEVALGDMIDVVNSKLEIDDKVRFIRHKYNLFQPWNCEFELGDPIERLVEKLKASFNTTDFIDNTFDSTGNMSGWKLVDGTVINNKIAEAAIEASKLNTKQIILTGDAWQNNTPSNGYVTWNAHKIAFNGVSYEILGGNTNKKYIVWRKSISETTYQTYTEDEFAAIALADDEFIIAINNSGIHDIAWYSRLARQFIGSAFIADLAVKSAHIAELAVTSAKIADLAVTNAKIGLAAIKNANIENLAVDTLKIGDIAITEAKLADLAVSTNKIANLAVTTAKIANLAVTNAKIESLSADKITAGTIEALISIMSPIIYSGIYYGLGSSPAFMKIGNISSNFADFSLYRGGASIPMFQIYDGAPVVLLKALNSSNVLNTFLETTGSTSSPQGTWDFSDATVSGINAVAKFA